jgi:hypothetical protein
VESKERHLGELLSKEEELASGLKELQQIKNKPL